MRLALCAFASLVVLRFVLCLEPRVVYVIEVYFRGFFVDDVDSIFDASPESCKASFGLKLRVEGKEPGVTDGTVVESSLILRPEHSSERSFHGFGFDEVSLMGGEFVFFGLISCLSDEVIEEIGFHDGAVEDAFFEGVVLADFVQDGEGATGGDSGD